MSVDLGSAYGTIEIGTEGAQASVQSLASSLRSTGQTLSLAVSAPLLGVGAAAVASAAGFEQSLNVMQQVSGATATQMEALQATALQLGAETSFSAGEAASAMLELAKAGLSVDEVQGAIAGTLDLAAAGGLGLAQAAEIAANAVNTFGLDATQTATVANLLAAAANASSVEVTDLAAGFQMAGSVFASNGQSVTDLTAALGLLGNAGIKGSDAGTSLKTMLMRLAAPTDEATAAMQGLGLNVYNADGSMRPFSEIVGSLATATAGLSDQQRNAALSTIFGADAIRAATILATAGATGFAQMTGAVSQQGAAADVANARMKGFGGAMEYLKGSIDSFLIGAALPFLDSLGGMVRMVADAVTAFGGLPQPVINAGLAFAGVMAAAGPLMVALPAIGTAVAALLSPVGLVAVAVAALAAAWVTDFGGIRSAVEPIVMAMVGWFQAQLPGAIATLQAGVAGVPAALAPVTAWFQAFMAQAAVIGAQLQAFLAPAIGRLQAGFASLGVQVGAMAPQFAGLVAAGQALWSALQPILAGLAQAVGASLAVAMSLGLNLLGAAFQNLSGLVGPIISQVTASINFIATTVKEVATLVAAVAAGDWSAAWASMQRIVGNFGSFFETTLTNVQTFGTTAISTLATAVTDTLTDMGVDVESVLTGLKATWESVFNALKGPIDTVIGAVQGLWDKVQAFADWWNGLKLGNPLEAVGDLANQAQGALGGVGAGIQDAAGAVGNFFTGGGGDAEGASWHRGGLTWVGERGPELVVMPPGAEVLTNGQSRRAGGGESRVININLGGVTVGSELDVHTLGWKLASVLEGFGV